MPYNAQIKCCFKQCIGSLERLIDFDEKLYNKAVLNNVLEVQNDYEGLKASSETFGFKQCIGSLEPSKKRQKK